MNFIRAGIKQGRGKPSVMSKEDLDDDKYFLPVLEDDAVLFSLDELETLQTNSDGAQGAAAGDAGQRPVDGDDADPLSRVRELEEQLLRTQRQFEEYKKAVTKMLEERWNDGPPEGPNASESSSHALQPNEDRTRQLADDNDKAYFQSYSYNEIHETMLQDTVRTDAYRDFIYGHKHLFKDKVVLDVGCGTGILSMFCARAGAKRVIAVDNSAIIDKAREIVFVNGLQDRITCVRGKIEEVTLPLKEVDIIVSEWMGYCLLYEAMLDSVLWARDRYLKPDGLMVPSTLTLRIAPVADPDHVAEHVSFWREVYGFDMKPMMTGICDDVLIRHLNKSALVGKSWDFLHLDLYQITKEDLWFTRAFDVELDRDVDALDGWDIWFDTFFLPSRSDHIAGHVAAESWKGKGIAFTTGPFGKESHWKSGYLQIDHQKLDPRSLVKGQRIKGSISYKKREENVRELDVEVEWSVDGADREKQTWHMR